MKDSNVCKNCIFEFTVYDKDPDDSDCKIARQTCSLYRYIRIDYDDTSYCRSGNMFILDTEEKINERRKDREAEIKKHKEAIEALEQRLRNYDEFLENLPFARGGK